MFPSSSTDRARRDIAAEITAKILADLDQGVMPWRKPWDGARTGLALPRRATGEIYRGANVVLLWATAAARGYGSPYWLTFNQAVKLGAHVRKGERGEIVVYYGQATRSRTGNGDPGNSGADPDGATSADNFRFLKSYVAFNADQIDGLQERFHPAPVTAETLPILSHEAWFARLEIARIRLQDTACYIPGRDVIGMPPLAAFDTPEDYAATLNHEACHATGAKHRLDRDFSARFGDAAHAAEELVAEIGASILGAHLQLPPHHIHDHAAYIGHWMELLRHDKRAFLTAAGKAQAAVDWLLDKSPVPTAATSTVEASDVAA